jgi:hypothetical protein
MPTDVEALGDTGSVLVRWSVPKDDGGIPIEGYRIYRGISIFHWVLLAEVTSGLEYVDDNVVPGQTYFYTVAALNVGGEGPPSSRSNATAIGTPGTPRDLRLIVNGSKAFLHWSEPASDGGSPLTSYILLMGMSPNDLSTVEELELVTQHDLGKLKEGRTYYLTVVASNDVGQGEPAAIIVYKVPKKASDDTPGFAAPLIILAAIMVAVSTLKGRKRAGNRWA